MPLPSSAPIRLQQVATEVGASLPYTLNDSRTHTLFGVSGNPIRLLQGLGKSNAHRPTAVTYSGTGSNSGSGQAYDSAGTSTYETVASAVGTAIASSYIATYTGIGAYNGTLSIYISTFTAWDDYDIDYSQVTIEYNRNGSWYALATVIPPADLVYTSPQTVALSGITSDVQVRITCTHTRSGTLKTGFSIANSSAYVYDIILV